MPPPPSSPSTLQTVWASPKRSHVLAVLYGLPFVYVGIMHFVDPELFMVLMPAYFGYPKFWVLLTGVTEIAVGLGIMLPATRRFSARVMIVQLCFLYLANLNMCIHDVEFDGMQFGTAGHILRLCAQIGLIIAAGAIGGLWPGRANSA